MTWLGILNFAVLQWFGIRLARVTERPPSEVLVILAARGFRVPEDGRVTVGWRVLRWIWPLTGWWSDCRYIRRPRRRQAEPLATRILERLRRDRFIPEPGERDIAYQVGWNDHAGHAIRIVLELDRSNHDAGDEDFHR
jgi:hypothetical protein